LVIVDYISVPVVFSNISIFIFPNGKVKVAGAKTINTINIMIDELIELIKYVNGPTKIGNCSLKAENIKIQMICSDFKIKPIREDPDGWCIKQEILKNILVNKYSLSATFSALSRYPGINVKVKSLTDDKNISLLIFRSGSIIITGAKSFIDISNCYSLITEIITAHSQILFYYDINEDIKQKKKNKHLT
jgi:TATA-box binding protein (TBP) (component of TFIID and TFIIIB)